MSLAIGMATMVGWLADTSCTGGAVCWLEKHPGSAAWLQGAGTIVALTVATGAYVRFYLEGFRPRTHARCNPDGGRALLTVSNVGRATGTVDYVLVGKGRRLRNGYTPVIYAQRKGEAPPCDLGATETMRLLLDADKQKFRFTDKSVRIAIVLGDKVKRTRVRPLRRGRKISAALFNVTPPAEATMEPKEQLAEATEEPKKELAEPDSAPIEEPAVPRSGSGRRLGLGRDPPGVAGTGGAPPYGPDLAARSLDRSLSIPPPGPASWSAGPLQ